MQVQVGPEDIRDQRRSLVLGRRGRLGEGPVAQVGFQLHGQLGTVPVRAVETGSEAETYNLIVEWFHTYFVGEGKVLCHDNTGAASRPTVRYRVGRLVAGEWRTNW